MLQFRSTESRPVEQAENAKAEAATPKGINVVRLVAEYGPAELAEIDSEIEKYEVKLHALRARRGIVSRLVSIATTPLSITKNEDHA